MAAVDLGSSIGLELLVARLRVLAVVSLINQSLRRYWRVRAAKLRPCRFLGERASNPLPGRQQLHGVRGGGQRGHSGREQS